MKTAQEVLTWSRAQTGPGVHRVGLYSNEQEEKHEGRVKSVTLFPALWCYKMRLNRSSAWKRIKSKRKIASVIISEHLICHLLYDICMRLI